MSPIILIVIVIALYYGFGSTVSYVYHHKRMIDLSVDLYYEQINIATNERYEGLSKSEMVAVYNSRVAAHVNEKFGKRPWWLFVAAPWLLSTSKLRQIKRQLHIREEENEEETSNPREEGR